MKRFYQYWRSGLGLALVLGGFSAAGASAAYEEVRGLIEKNLPGVTAQELDQAALDGLLKEFHGRVSLVSETDATSSVSATGNLLTRTNCYDGQFGYLRINRVGEGLAEAVAAACQKLAAARAIRGWVVDLRFARGTDYQAAARVADLFALERQPLLEWKGETIYATTKTNALAGPAVMLVDQATTGAAEVLAAMLREIHLGLILGQRTAGQAAGFKDFPLASGQTLRIATETMKLGEGQVLVGTGIRPDIEVRVSPGDEKRYFANEYYQPSPTEGTTNAVSAANRVTHRLTEADLVRMKKEGQELDGPIEASPTKKPVKEKQLVRDPALARALDLLKGLAVIQSNRKP